MGLAVVEVARRLFLLELAQFGVGWQVWLAVVSVLAWFVVLAVVAVLRRPQSSALLSRTLMNGSTLHSRLLVGFRLVAVAPVLTLLPLLAIISTATVQDTQLPQIEQLSSSIAASVPGLIQGRVSGVDALAGHISAAGNVDERALRDALLRHHSSSPEFASLWIARPTGDIVVATVLRDGQVETWSGPVAGVAMMDSFKRAVIAGKVYVAPVEKGAAAEAAPMVFVSAPVALDGDTRWGFVQGLMNLRTAIGGLVDQGTADGVAAIIVDQRNRVVLSSPGLALGTFTDLSGHALLSVADSEPAGTAFGFSGVLNADAETERYVAVGRSLDNGWRVFVAATQASADLTLLIYMTLGLIWALLAVTLARGLAPLYGRDVSRPLQKLDDSLDAFDAERTISIIPPPPTDAPREIRQTYARVRESMRSSRDAYRNMIKAVGEGVELRKALRDVGVEDANGVAAVTTSKPGSPDASPADESPTPDATWVGRLDSVTELSGVDVFEGFFGEAWSLGVTDSRPMAVVLLRIGATGDQALKLLAQKLKGEVGRTLDLVARIGAWDFGIILPDTDLNGALAVAEKMRDSLQGDLAGQPLTVSFGASSIVPNANGNAQSFLGMCHRALTAASKEGDGHIAFVGNNGKLGLHTRSDLVDWDPAEDGTLTQNIRA